MNGFRIFISTIFIGLMLATTFSTVIGNYYQPEDVSLISVKNEINNIAQNPTVIDINIDDQSNDLESFTSPKPLIT